MGELAANEMLAVSMLTGGIVGAVLGGLVVIGTIISLALNVLNIIGAWKVYNKMGEPGWKCLIPFYGTWVEYKYTWKPVMAIPLWVLGFVCGMIMQQVPESTPLWYVLMVLTLVGWVFQVMGYHYLSKSFGHGVGFTVGMVLAPGIFRTILGLGKSEYIGNTVTGAKPGEIV